MKLNAKLFLAASLIFVLAAQVELFGQKSEDYRLTFNRGFEGSFFSYRTGQVGSFTVSPGGVFRLPSELAVFDTFAEFEDEVVGQWLVVDGDNFTTFEILPFQEKEFPIGEVINPLDGSSFMSGETFFPVVKSSRPFVLKIVAEFALIGILPIQDGFQGFLLDGVFEAPVRISACSSIPAPQVISNVNADQVDFTISPPLLSGFSNFVEIIYFENSVLGDVNRDGVVDLLDVDAFTDLVISGEFQFEADVNGDGSVDLLDIAPFVDLLP